MTMLNFDDTTDGAGNLIPRLGLTLPTRKEHSDLIQQLVEDAIKHTDGSTNQHLAERLARHLDAIFTDTPSLVPSGERPAPTPEEAINAVIEECAKIVDDEIWHAQNRMAAIVSRGGHSADGWTDRGLVNRGEGIAKRIRNLKRNP